MHVGARALLIAAFLTAAAAVEASPLQVDGSLTSDDPPAVRIAVRNSSDAPVRDVVPTVTFEHQHYPGPPAALEPGAQHAWRLGLPPSSRPGTSPVTVQVQWTDASGARHTVPFVVLLSTSADPEPVDVAWTLESVAPVAHTRVRLENRGTRPVVGRLAFFLPGGLRTEPEGQPVTVAAGASTVVPVAIESRGAAPGTYPAYALLTYSDADRRHAALAPGELTVDPTTRGMGALPLAIGSGAVVLACALLGLAVRSTRRAA